MRNIFKTYITIHPNKVFFLEKDKGFLAYVTIHNYGFTKIFGASFINKKIFTKKIYLTQWSFSWHKKDCWMFYPSIDQKRPIFTLGQGLRALSSNIYCNWKCTEDPNLEIIPDFTKVEIVESKYHPKFINTSKPSESIDMDWKNLTFHPERYIPICKTYEPIFSFKTLQAKHLTPKYIIKKDYDVPHREKHIEE